MATTTPTIIATMATTKMMGTAMAAAVALSLSDAAPVAVEKGRAWHNGHTLMHIEGRRDYVPTHHMTHVHYDHVFGMAPEEMGCANLLSRVPIPQILTCTRASFIKTKEERSIKNFITFRLNDIALGIERFSSFMR